MAITTPADLVILGPEDFPLGAMPGPLDTVLKNSNFLYTYHRPPMLSVAYCSNFEIGGRTVRFTMPCKPSADGLIYEFTSKVLSNAAGAWQLTVQIETYDATNGWVVLATQATAQVAGIDAVITDTQTGVIAADVTLLRMSYTATGGALLTPHHLLVIPTPGTVTSGIKLSGFVPYDDGQLSTTGAVTTEHVDRPHANAINVLRDRAQCAFAWVQEDTPANMTIRPGLAAFVLWRTSPAVRVGLHGQQGTLSLDVGILAGVTRGAGTVRLQQHQAPIAGAYYEAAADGNLHSGVMQVTCNGGGPDAYVDLSVACKLTDPLGVLDLYAVVAWWRPTT